MALNDVTREAVLKAIADFDGRGRDAFLAHYGFAEATRYLIVHAARFYDSKAIVGVAHGYLPGQKPLTAKEFSGGIDAAVRRLRELGFEVVASAPGSADEVEGGAWSAREIERTVAAYFDLFREIRLGRSPVKKAVYQSLHEEMPQRTAKAFERKFMNISFWLDEDGFEWISGLPPAKGAQAALREPTLRRALADGIPRYGKALAPARPVQAKRTYLLTWNPARWTWTNLDEQLAASAAGKPVIEKWSTGNTRSIEEGDRLFLLKLGEDPRGLMGAGHAVGSVTEDPHWDPVRRERGDTTPRVQVRFERLVARDSVLPVEALRTGPLGEIHWSPQSSGTQVPTHLAAALEEVWERFQPHAGASASPDELTPGVKYIEGAALSVVVNRYERDPEARKACIRLHGTDCAVCGFSFARRYGRHGAGFIHVHHLSPLAQGDGHGAAVDPERDLRPVCPNCHAMLHRGERLLSIQELKAMLR
jgi:5-methylcytosine-specific restriction protein A